MGGVQRRKSNTKNKKIQRGLKTRHYTKDHDQIHDDLKNEEKFENLEIDEDKPGAGQFYCVGCSRFFESNETLNVHKATKKHKRMVKRMLEDPYTHKEAYEAGK